MRRPRFAAAIFLTVVSTVVAGCAWKHPRSVGVDAPPRTAAAPRSTVWEDPCPGGRTAESLPADEARIYVLCREARIFYDPDAALTLSLLYSGGSGVEADPETALAWNYFAQWNGCLNRQPRRRAVDLELGLTPAQRRNALLRARTWDPTYRDPPKDDK